MPTNSLFIDAADTDLENKVSSLARTPGYCIFIDVVGSTEMKEKSICEWVAFIHNFFSTSKTFLSNYSPLKSIGDELMYFIEDSDLQCTGETPLQIFDGLFQIANDLNKDFPSTKIVAAYCSSVYPMTFIKGTQDYYGIDIDRAARLNKICPAPMEREVVIDLEMYLKIEEDYNSTINKGQFSSFLSLKGPTSHEAKGISLPIEVYRTA